MSNARSKITVRQTRPEDFPGIDELTRAVYPGTPTWTAGQLSSHLRVFPEGQLVAIDTESQRVVGMAASLIVYWDDYEMQSAWRDFTDYGMFTNHDPVHGRTLYAAEVMVRPNRQGQGIGKKLYQARRDVAQRLGLLRIRAGARLRNYHRHARRMSAEEYVLRVIRKELGDATLSFQLRQGFEVLAVVSGYLQHDPDSLGYAAVIEWLNPLVAKPEDYAGRDPKFAKAPLDSATERTSD
jgi:predicted N-acetyltransferase YhbS